VLGFFKRLFASGSASSLAVEAYWCETAIKLPTKVQTPLGSNVSVVKVCVDIYYSIDGDRILIQRVKMARGGGSVMGSTSSINVASDRTGEAWYSSHLCSERYLIEAVEQDLSAKGSRLRKIMMGKWREVNRGSLVVSLTDVLNAHSRPEQIAELISNAGRGNEIVFVYSKPNGEETTRHVTVEGVSGDSIRALDHKDGKVKSFRIDRISRARRA
jgi:hypothetical protein